MNKKILLTRPARFAIMIFLIAGFFIISPLVILYTIGYRYDLTTGIVRETGVLSVDVEPDDAKIFLDAVEIKKRIPIRLTDLIPGTYQLSIQKDSYHAWNKEILVESKQTTYIRDITLFRKENLEQAFDIGEPIRTARGSYDGAFLLLVTHQESVYDVILLDTRTGEQTMIVRVEADDIPTIEWSDIRHDAVIALTHNQIPRLYLFSAERPETIRSYTYRTQQSDSVRQWPHGLSETAVYLSEGNAIYRVGINNTSLVGTASGVLWHVDDRGTLFTTRNNQKTLVNAEEPNMAAVYQTDEPIKRIVAMERNQIITETTGGVRVLVEKNGKIEQAAALPTHAIRYNQTTNEWITWSPWEVWSIYEDGSTALLNRVSEQVSNVVPLDHFGVLLLIRDGSLTAFNPGYFVRHTLLEKIEKKFISVDIDARAIYLLTPETSLVERLAY